MRQHPIGTLFCQARGTNIAKWQEEKALWKRVARAAHASITIRPWQWQAILFCAVLAGVLFAMFIHGPISGARVTPEGAVLVSAVLGFLVAFLSFVIPLAIVDNRVDDRRRALFREQGYQTLTEHPDILFLRNES